MDFSTLNCIEGSVLNGDFDDIVTAEYEPFLIDKEPEYDVFKFDDLCFFTDCLLASTATSKSVPPLASLELKPLLNSLNYSFLGPSESLLVIIAYDLDLTKRTN